MSNDRRNPYLVLGVPYGTSRAEATRAFAQRSRRAKREPDYPYSVDDLTWALHQIEALLDDPTIAIDHFRVPADPAVLQPPDGPGILRPDPQPLPRRTEANSSASREALRALAASEAVDVLLDRAAAAAREAYPPVEPSALGSLRPQSQPRRPRRVWPWLLAFLILGLLAASVAVAILVQDDPESAPTPTSAPTTVATTTATVPPATIPPTPIVGEPITQPGPSGDLTLRATDPINAFGFLCILFEVSGTPPLVFLPQTATATVTGGPTYNVDPAVATGRAPNGDVFGDVEPTTREACWPAEGFESSGALISYAFESGAYEWALPPIS